MIRSCFIRSLALRLTPVLALAAGTVQAAITIDLSYVDTQSTAYARFTNWVNQAYNGSPGYGFSAADAVTQARITSEARYCVLAVSMIDTQVGAAETRIAAGQNPEVAGDSYLQAGPMIGDLALTYDWCAAQINATQRTRWANYAERTIQNIWNPSQAQWGGRAATWSGWGTNDPANNYYYSFLRATMYWALASNSATWRNFLETQKLPPLTSYFALLPGGGSEEGTGYGTSHHKLFELYRVWRDSTGQDLASVSSHLTDTVSYWLHATVPTLNRFAPYGDQARSSNPEFYDYHRHLLLEARRMTGNAVARDLAAWWLRNNSVQAMASGFNLRDDLLPAGAAPTQPGGGAPLTYIANGIGHLFTRTAWSPSATWLSFSAGSYDQSHAHQDQGSFTLFSGNWLAVTENIWSRSGIQQGTEVHNLVRFVRNSANVRQRSGTRSTMTVHQLGPSAGEVHVSGDMSAVYPAGGGVNAWTRRLDFTGSKLVVSDQFAVASGMRAIFQINTPNQPVISGREATAGALKIRVIEPSQATLSVVDWRSVNSDFNSGWKLEIEGPATNTGFIVELTTGEQIFKGGFETL